ncbi:MAG: hypothetical protein JXQ65_01240 [Candidatus Marinimicrobia bacterium]|nr:hypothetical protein [Candidatus Neomarinimicrobiota bacterium]
MKKTIIIFIVFSYLLITGCSYERLAMPNSQDTTKIFNTGEIKYIQLNPVWENFTYPIDIFISYDDYIFLADSGNARVMVLDKTGQSIMTDESNNDFSVLQNLNFHPVGLCVDSKLNLFITDKTNKIYVWNQFVNNASNAGEGVGLVATSIEYRNSNTGDMVTITDFEESYDLENGGYIINHVEYEENREKIDSILAVHPFYVDEEMADSKFISVAAGPSSKGEIYVTDEGEQAIHRIKLVRSAYLKLANGTTVWQHKGVRNGSIATAGTGAGTVNDPTGIFADQGGNVYYTQTGINFGFHKISEISEEEKLWSSMFTLGQNEILDLQRFDQPADVAVDGDGNIFVLNTGDREVQVFDAGGKFIRKAGLRSVQIDTTINQKDTIVTRYYNDVLNNPRGIFIDDGVIYIVNSGDRNILRFRLSSDVDIDPEEYQ